MKRLLRPSLVALGTLTALIGGGSILAYASWVGRSDSPTFTVRAAGIPRIPRPSVTLAPAHLDGLARPGTLARPRRLLPAPRIRWRTVEITPDRAVHRYIVTRHAGPTAAVVCTLPATGPVSCLDRTAPAGSSLTYTVAAAYGTHWVGQDSEPSPAVTTPGTPVAITVSGVPVAPGAPSAAALADPGTSTVTSQSLPGEPGPTGPTPGTDPPVNHPPVDTPPSETATSAPPPSEIAIPPSNDPPLAAADGAAPPATIP